MGGGGGGTDVGSIEDVGDGQVAQQVQGGGLHGTGQEQARLYAGGCRRRRRPLQHPQAPQHVLQPHLHPSTPPLAPLAPQAHLWTPCRTAVSYDTNPSIALFSREGAGH